PPPASAAIEPSGPLPNDARLLVRCVPRAKMHHSVSATAANRVLAAGAAAAAGASAGAGAGAGAGARTRTHAHAHAHAAQCAITDPRTPSSPPPPRTCAPAA